MKIEYDGEVVAKIELNEGEALLVGKSGTPLGEMLIYNNLGNLQMISSIEWKEAKAKKLLRQLDIVFGYFKRCCEAFEKILDRGNKYYEWVLQIHLGKEDISEHINCTVSLQEYNSLVKTDSEAVCLLEGPKIILDNNDAVVKYFIALIMQYALKKGYFKTDAVRGFYDEDNIGYIYDSKFIRKLGKRDAESKVLSYDKECVTLATLMNLIAQAVKSDTDNYIIQGLRQDAIHSIVMGDCLLKDFTMDGCVKKVDELIPKLTLSAIDLPKARSVCGNQ